LVIAAGSRPFIPPVEGVDLAGVTPAADLHHAEAIKNLAAKGQVGSAVIVGAGATGLEMAEALNDLWGIEVHIVEMADQILPGLMDAEFARMLQTHLAAQEDLHLHLNSPLEAGLDDGQGHARGVRAGGREYEADLVILAAGVRPNSDLARRAGLDIAENGGIVVNSRMQTSDPDVFAAGDCVSIPNLITGQPMYVSSGSLANRQGRVVGTNVCGGDDAFPGAAGSFCIKLYGLTAARTGLDEAQARALGLEQVAAPLVVQADRAHFHPDQKLMYVKLVADGASGRVLGLTALGENGDAAAGRVGALAGLIAAGAKLEDVSNLELPYSPPLGAALDIINAAANTCQNLIAGKLRPLSPEEFSRRLAQRESGSTVFLDMRAIDNAKPFLEALSPHWVHLPQETLAQRLDEAPRDRDVVLICNSGVRSYEAQVALDAAGVKNTFNLSGGIAAVKKWGEPIIPPKEE
jgi:NADPH-dependent 2,4-dienoyl-CoA reductase/sulfur reductase-like enzyme/rhodanese-related sulfurtransferase